MFSSILQRIVTKNRQPMTKLFFELAGSPDRILDENANAFRQVQFHRMIVPRSGDSKSYHFQQIVITEFRERYKSKAHFSNKALSAIEESKVDRQFVFTDYLYRHRDGITIMIKVDSDLFDYLNAQNAKGDLSIDSIKPILAQIILAIRAFHEKNMIHGDVRCENIFLFLINNKVHIKLADLDDSRKVGAKLDPQNKYVGVPPFLPSDNKRSAYDQQGLEWYCLACVMLEKIDHFFKFHSSEELRSLKNFLNKLKGATSFNKAKEIIDGASFFGETSKARQEYFASIKRNYCKDCNLQGKKQCNCPLSRPATFPAVNSPDRLIGLISEDAGKVFQLCNTFVKPKKVPVSIAHEKSLGFLDEKYLDKENETIPQPLSATNAQAQVVEMQALTQHFTPKDPNQKIFAPFMQSVFNATGLFLQDPRAKDCLKEITLQSLKECVQVAKNFYIQRNNRAGRSCWSRLFHGDAGKERAEKFNNLIQRMNDKINIFDVLYNHLERGKGNWYEDSFKAILAKELGKLSFVPFEQWKKYMTDDRKRVAIKKI